MKKSILSGADYTPSASPLKRKVTLMEKEIQNKEREKNEEIKEMIISEHQNQKSKLKL